MDSIYEGGLVGLLLGLAAHLADGGRHGVVVGARTTLPLVLALLNPLPCSPLNMLWSLASVGAMRTLLHCRPIISVGVLAGGGAVPGDLLFAALARQTVLSTNVSTVSVPGLVPSSTTTLSGFLEVHEVEVPPHVLLVHVLGGVVRVPVICENIRSFCLVFTVALLLQLLVDKIPALYLVSRAGPDSAPRVAPSPRASAAILRLKLARFDTFRSLDAL